MFNNELWQKPAASAGGDFYSHQIANSVRFNASATAHMYHTQGTPTNVDKCTISFWVKRAKLGATMYGMTGSGASGSYSHITFGGDGSDADKFYWLQNPGSPTIVLESNPLFRDTSAWYNIILANDSTQSTDSDRNKIYINGVQLTDWGTGFTPSFYSTQNSDFLMNTSGHKLFVGSGGDSGGNAYLPFDGYIAEYVFIDGTQYASTDFGESKNGVWIPKDPSGLTFGNNGCYLKFESSSDLGNDSSGNNNDFTVSNVSAHDQMLDSPTFNSSSNGGNFATLNPLSSSPDNILTEGNLKATKETGANFEDTAATMNLKGKYYLECCVKELMGVDGQAVGLVNVEEDLITSRDGRLGETGVSYRKNGKLMVAGTENTFGSTWSAGDIVQMAVDMTDINSVKVWFGLNNTWQNSGNPSAGSGIAATITNGEQIMAMSAGYSGTGELIFNFGQDGTFAGEKTAQGNSDATGYGNFYYSPPTNFLALCSGNLPVADAIDPAQTDDNYPQKLFGAKLYTGDGGSSTGITGVGFQPDFVWIKRRNAAENHNLYDSTRGVNKRIQSNRDVAETTEGLPAFGSDGFTVDASGGINNVSSQTYVAWNWRANGGTTSTNSTGTVNATQQVDPTGGFSISTYTGTGSSMTVGHGLSAEPKITIIKDRSATADWVAYTKVIDGSLDYFELNTHDAAGDSGFTGPNSTIWNFDGESSYSNTSGRNYIMYNFTNIEGYCKVGSYYSNTSATDNAFVYLGFRPAFLLIKAIGSGCHWQLIDNKRNGFNPQPESLDADRSNASRTNATQFADLLSNGFKVRTDNQVLGEASKNPYIYLAFAHNPFKYATAR